MFILVKVYVFLNPNDNNLCNNMIFIKNEIQINNVGRDKITRKKTASK